MKKKGGGKKEEKKARSLGGCLHRPQRGEEKKGKPPATGFPGKKKGEKKAAGVTRIGVSHFLNPGKRKKKEVGARFL